MFRFVKGHLNQANQPDETDRAHESRAAYAAGVDGGATKTAVVLADERGTITAEAETGPSNFQIIGIERASRAIADGIQECCTRARCSPGLLRSVVAGVTGAGRPHDQERLRAALAAELAARGINPALDVMSDALIALEGAFGGEAGAILIAGTGSVAFAKMANGSVKRVGGWGRLLGDEGGGFAVGRAALAAVCRHLDGRGPATTLTQMVAAIHGLSSQEQIIRMIYEENFDPSTLAPMVLEAAGRKDAVSAAIVATAAADLVDHVRALVPPAGKAAQPFRVALIGSMLAGTNALSGEVRRRIAEDLPGVLVVEPKDTPARGAVTIALRLHRTTTQQQSPT